MENIYPDVPYWFSGLVFLLMVQFSNLLFICIIKCLPDKILKKIQNWVLNV